VVKGPLWKILIGHEAGKGDRARVGLRMVEPVLYSTQALIQTKIIEKSKKRVLALSPWRMAIIRPDPKFIFTIEKNLLRWGHPLAGRSRSTDVSREKNFLLSPLFSLLAQPVIFR
jgi:hypothetical protein